LIARQTAKRKVAAELAAGRLTLVEAAARIRHLKDGPDNFWTFIRANERGNSDEERLCRHVIGWTEATLFNRPAEAARITARLEAELKNHLRRNGKVILPR
jgi:hypothetical protein